MTIHEKLVELLCKTISPTITVGEQADFLIANGVTFAEDTDDPTKWISVKERLPDLIPCNAGTAYSEAVIVWTSGKKAMIAVYDGISFVCPMDFWDAWGEEITHWMPLPTPPKEG